MVLFTEHHTSTTPINYMVHRRDLPDEDAEECGYTGVSSAGCSQRDRLSNALGPESSNDACPQNGHAC